MFLFLLTILFQNETALKRAAVSVEYAIFIEGRAGPGRPALPPASQGLISKKPRLFDKDIKCLSK
jgi:hypothetical protein